MTFSDLLKDKDAAVEAHDAAVAHLNEVNDWHRDATEGEAKTLAARLAAHQAIVTMLAVGDRCIVDQDGTVTIYRTREVTEHAPHGWASYHPALGSEA